MTKHLLTICALAFWPVLSHAHYLWIESEEGEPARISFGEFNEGVREKAGGRLDERAALEGRAVRDGGAVEPLRFEKKADHFSAKVTGAGWLLVEDLTCEVKDWTASDIGIVKPKFYARAAIEGALTPAEPALALDILPVGQDARTLRVLFKGKPLAKAKVMVHAPNQWSQELATNEIGELTIKTPWPGRYVVEVIHKERVAGEFEGKAYEAVRHRVTFSHVY